MLQHRPPPKAETPPGMMIRRGFAKNRSGQKRLIMWAHGVGIVDDADTAWAIHTLCLREV